MNIHTQLRYSELNIPDYTLHDLLFSTETEHSKDHQSRQHRREEVNEGDGESVAVAVVVPGVVGGVGDNGAEAEAQRKEDLRGRLPPHLHICPDF